MFMMGFGDDLSVSLWLADTFSYGLQILYAYFFQKGCWLFGWQIILNCFWIILQSHVITCLRIHCLSALHIICMHICVFILSGPLFTKRQDVLPPNLLKPRKSRNAIGETPFEISCSQHYCETCWWLNTVVIKGMLYIYMIASIIRYHAAALSLMCYHWRDDWPR